MKQARVLGSRVDLVEPEEAVKLIQKWIEVEDVTPAVMKLVVTAYSEFFVTAVKDAEFKAVLEEADLVVPDGISVLAAAKYKQMARDKWQMVKFLKGLEVGLDILDGRVGKPVTGVWLFGRLTALAAQKKWKVFLLGAAPGVVQEVKLKLKSRYPNLVVEADSGEAKVGTDAKKAAQVLSKINRFRPDLLFVAYNPVTQEKWLAKNRKRIKTKVALGVGGTFNEFVGLEPAAPEMLRQAGLKWLWRLMTQPRRLPRVLKAFPVFPWLVFKESLRD